MPNHKTLQQISDTSYMQQINGVLSIIGANLAQNNDISIPIVDLTPITIDKNLASKTVSYCNFCEKPVELNAEQAKIHEKLSGRGFYCSSCIRHNWHTRLNKNVLPLSFRSIIAYYYYRYYRIANPSKKWLSEIQDIVDKHTDIGLSNPVFSYDLDNFMWFIDFNKVGRGTRKIPVEEVFKTTNKILDVFEIDKLGVFKKDKFYEKYKTSIKKFYELRQRPAGKRLLIPTFQGCCYQENKKSAEIENIRDFYQKDLRAI